MQLTSAAESDTDGIDVEQPEEDCVAALDCTDESESEETNGTEPDCTELQEASVTGLEGTELEGLKEAVVDRLVDTAELEGESNGSELVEAVSKEPTLVGSEDELPIRDEQQPSSFKDTNRKFKT